MESHFSNEANRHPCEIVHNLSDRCIPRESQAGGRPLTTWVLLLLAISVFLNYVDRADLSIITPQLQGDLGFSVPQLGFLLSAFFWTYASMTLVSGWLIDRFHVNVVLTVGFALCSIATAATALAHSLAAIIIVRLLIGAAASVALPSYSTIFAAFLPESRRGVANAFIAVGCALGPAAVFLFGGPLVQRLGWRECFEILGLASLVWLIPWYRCMPRSQTGSYRAKTGPIPAVSQILKHRSAWGTFLGLFCILYFSYSLITWLPYYLIQDRHLSVEAAANVAGSAFFAIAASAIASGRLSDYWITMGGTPTRVRKTFTAVGMGLASIISLVPVAHNTTLLTIVLVIACTAFGISYSNIWTVTQTLAGVSAVARWSGLKNFFGNLAGVVAPVVTGLVVNATGQFSASFVIIGAVCLIGAGSWMFVVGPIAAIDWKPATVISNREGGVVGP